MAKKSREFVEEYCVKPTYDSDGVQVSAGIGLDGKEVGDPHPLSPPVGYDPGPDLGTMIRTMIQSEKFRLEQEQAGLETFEEADDFDIEDDPLDPLTEYERVFEPPPEVTNPLASGGGAPSSSSASPAPDKSSEGALSISDRALASVRPPAQPSQSEGQRDTHNSDTHTHANK